VIAIKIFDIIGNTWYAVGALEEGHVHSYQNKIHKGDFQMKKIISTLAALAIIAIPTTAVAGGG